MQRWHGWLAATILSAALAGATARADEEKEEKVPLDKVPKAVLKAVKAKFQDAKLVGAEKENENGKIRYEIKLARKNQKIEAKVTRKGKILLIEKTIFAKKSKEEGEDDEKEAKKGKKKHEDDENDKKEFKKGKKEEVKKGKKNEHEDDDEKEGKKKEVKKGKKKHEEEDEDDEKEMKKGKHKKSKKREKDKD
jgi:hypothetical protein